MSEPSAPYNLEERSSGYYRVGLTPEGVTIVTGMAPLNPAYTVEQRVCQDCQILMQNVTFEHCPNCDGVNLAPWQLETRDRVLIKHGFKVG